MSLDKAIEHNKEYRKQYEGGKYYLISYRNHEVNSQARHHRDVKLMKNKGSYNEEGKFIRK